MKIALQKCKYSSREILAVVDICSRNKVPFRQYEYGREVLKDEIAIGTVEFMEEALGKRFKPNYFPDWISHYVKRKYRISNTWPTDESVVKPNDRYKSFGLTNYKRGFENINGSTEFLIQEFVTPISEWRLYVTLGKITCFAWYQSRLIKDEGKELKDEIVKDIQQLIPEGWCGTIDLMETENGIELCECHHPYSIGWYGNPTENFLYFDFLIKGYEYLQNEKEL